MTVEYAIDTAREYVRKNIALRKALRDAELERDILKKALGIFSKSDR